MGHVGPGTVTHALAPMNRCMGYRTDGAVTMRAWAHLVIWEMGPPVLDTACWESLFRISCHDMWFHIVSANSKKVDHDFEFGDKRGRRTPRPSAQADPSYYQCRGAVGVALGQGTTARDGPDEPSAGARTRGQDAHRRGAWPTS